MEVFNLTREQNRSQMERINRLVNKNKTDEELMDIAERNKTRRLQRKLAKTEQTAPWKVDRLMLFYSVYKYTHFFQSKSLSPTLKLTGWTVALSYILVDVVAVFNPTQFCTINIFLFIFKQVTIYHPIINTNTSNVNNCVLVYSIIHRTSLYVGIHGHVLASLIACQIIILSIREWLNYYFQTQLFQQSTRKINHFVQRNILFGEAVERRRKIDISGIQRKWIGSHPYHESSKG